MIHTTIYTILRTQMSSCYFHKIKFRLSGDFFKGCNSKTNQAKTHWWSFFKSFVSYKNRLTTIRNNEEITNKKKQMKKRRILILTTKRERPQMPSQNNAMNTPYLCQTNVLFLPFLWVPSLLLLLYFLKLLHIPSFVERKNNNNGIQSRTRKYV